VRQLKEDVNEEAQSWRAIETILLIRMLVRQAYPQIHIEHASREHLKDAHMLANLARRQQFNYKGAHTMSHGSQVISKKS
jgi:hypothetical protein